MHRLRSQLDEQQLARPNRYESFCDALGAEGVGVARGVFGAHMRLALVNDGRVTIALDA